MRVVYDSGVKKGFNILIGVPKRPCSALARKRLRKFAGFAKGEKCDQEQSCAARI